MHALIYMLLRQAFQNTCNNLKTLTCMVNKNPLNFNNKSKNVTIYILYVHLSWQNKLSHTQHSSASVIKQPNWHSIVGTRLYT